MKNLNIYLLILLSLSQIIISESNEEIEILINIIECIEKLNQIGKNVTTTMKNLLYNYNPFNIQNVYEFMQENLNLVNICTNDLSDVPESLTRYIFPFNKLSKKFNWGKYLDCVINHIKRDNSLDEIIDFIKEKNYYNASMEEMKLLQEGNIVALQCANRKNENLDPVDIIFPDEDIDFN